MIQRTHDWWIFCDGCNEHTFLSNRTGDVYSTKRGAAKKAKQVFPDWKFLSDGTCLCPKCKEKKGEK